MRYTLLLVIGLFSFSAFAQKIEDVIPFKGTADLYGESFHKESNTLVYWSFHKYIEPGSNKEIKEDVLVSFDLETRKNNWVLVNPLDNHFEEMPITFSADGKYITAGYRDHMVYIRGIDDPSLFITFRPVTDPDEESIVAAYFHPNNPDLVFVLTHREQEDWTEPGWGRYQLWNFKTRKLVNEARLEYEREVTLGSMLYFATGLGKNVVVHKLPFGSGMVVADMEKGTADIVSIPMRLGGNIFVHPSRPYAVISTYSGFDDTILVVELKTGKSIDLGIEAHFIDFNMPDVIFEDQYFYATSEKGIVKVDLDSMQIVREYKIDSSSKESKLLQTLSFTDPSFSEGYGFRGHGTEDSLFRLSESKLILFSDMTYIINEETNEVTIVAGVESERRRFYRLSDDSFLFQQSREYESHKWAGRFGIYTILK